MKRDLHIWKETYIYEKRLTYMKRDLHIWKETCIYEKRLTYMKLDLDQCGPQIRVTWLLYAYTRLYTKRDFTHEKWLICMWPTDMCDVTYVCIYTDPPMVAKKRRIYAWKETSRAHVHTHTHTRTCTHTHAHTHTHT